MGTWEMTQIMARPLIQSLLVATVILQLIGFDSNRLAQAKISLLDEKKIDQNDEQLDSIARTVCDALPWNRQQIARVSTVVALRKFLSELGPDSSQKLQECARDHLESVELLELVVTKSNNNVCSEEKVRLIEQYHNLFVALGNKETQSRHKQNKRLGLFKLNTFFQHYAMEVSAMCRTTLINNIERDLGEVLGEDVTRKLVDFSGENEKGGDDLGFGLVFEDVLGKFMKLFSVQQYDDVVLVWDIIRDRFIKSSEPKSSSTVEPATVDGDQLDSNTGQTARLKIKTKSIQSLTGLQRHCRNKLKPIYSKLVLPVIQLANLGYSNNGERFEVELRELKSNKLVKRWYAATQMCETILPIKCYEDPTLEVTDLVVLTEEEAKELDEQGQQPVDDDQVEMIVYDPKSNTMEALDFLDSVTTVEAQELVKDIDLNSDAYSRTMGRVVANLMRILKTELNSRVSRFFFPQEKVEQSATSDEIGPQAEKSPDDPTKAHAVLQDVGPKFAQSLEDISEEEMMLLVGGSKRLDSSTTGTLVGRVRRRKRPGDMEDLLQRRAAILESKRTMSPEEIFAPVKQWFKDKLPNRRQMFVIGVFLVAILLLCLTVGKLSLVG